MRAGDKKGRERLLRYCARPTLSLERLSVLDDGRIAYRVKYPRRGGRTHLVMTPMQCMARLTALVPPPRYPLVRYSGVLAPASKWRKLIVPGGTAGVCAQERPRTSEPVHTASPPTPTIVGLPRPLPSENRSSSAAASPAYPEPRTVSFDPRDKFRGRRSTSYIDWASLMKRSMGIDVLECPRCSSTMKPVAVITAPDVIGKILVHLRLPLRPEQLADGATVVYDVTGEPVLDEGWLPAQDDGWGAPRGPPGEWDGVDARSPPDE